MYKKGSCWDGYVQAGMKKKGNRMVPNCVPAGSKKMAEGGLTKWFKEKWVDIGSKKKGGGFRECGRKSASGSKRKKGIAWFLIVYQQVLKKWLKVVLQNGLKKNG